MFPSIFGTLSNSLLPGPVGESLGLVVLGVLAPVASGEAVEAVVKVSEPVRAPLRDDVLLVLGFVALVCEET